MDITLQPKPEIRLSFAERKYVSKKRFFVKKVFEEINQYFFPGHLVREWKPKAELIYSTIPDEASIQYEYDFNRHVQNCFVEDYAEEVYLRSPPPCFVVIGKHGASVNKLSQDIADEYGSVLIQVDDIVDRVIHSECESAVFLKKVLRLGVSVTLNIILVLLSYLAHTPEARHRGYVLNGIPRVPFEHDLSVEQQINYIFSWENKPTVFIHVLFEDEDLVNTKACTRYEIQNNAQQCTLIPHQIPRETGISGKSKKIFDYENNRFNKEPYYKYREEDEEEFYYGPMCKTYRSSSDDSEIHNIDDENNDDDDDEEEQVFMPEPDINISPSRPWIKLPMDEESEVWSELELFDKMIKPAIKLLISRIDPQYFITVDSRVENEFEIVKARLSLLQIWKVPCPFPFVPLEDSKPNREDDNEDVDDEEDEENETIEKDEEMDEIRKAVQEPPQTAFLSLFPKKTLSPKFRWELSHYNYLCPVSLRKGEVIEGKSEFSVVFMKYIYFLRDRESLEQFLRNPRPFVLPIRPKPPSRFFIVGYPYCGKTTLGRSLATQFSVPLINFNTILRNDLETKKSVYQEFCRQKAESREMVRLTAQAWNDWRLEEEQRMTLIEEWIEYIQELLNQRIEQFYSQKLNEEETVTRGSLTEGSSVVGEDGDWIRPKKEASPLETQLEIRGVSIPISSPAEDAEYTAERYNSPSAKIVHALKHEDYDFEKSGLEVEANLFFSSLWSGFSKESIGSRDLSIRMKSEEARPESESHESDASNVTLVGDLHDSNTSINWCNLLPPQSLSSLFLHKKPCTVRQRRKSFQILLNAAAKAYWEPSALRTEFIKWKLPCFMDIPLCEKFVDNPLLLYKYIPDWVKERPMIPEPIDPNHFEIQEAGSLAFKRAGSVTIQHTNEEMSLLLTHAIEKAEKDGMRITGEIFTPGGWIVDDMTLDLQVWCSLIKQNIVPTHVYILIDTEPEFRRIINTWYNIYYREDESKVSEAIDLTDASQTSVDEGETSSHSSSSLSPRLDIIGLLLEACQKIAAGNAELDEIYDLLTKEEEESPDANNLTLKTFSVDPFTYNMISNRIEKAVDQMDEPGNDEPVIFAANYTSRASRVFFSGRHQTQPAHDMPLGHQLQVFTSKVWNMLKKSNPKMDQEFLEDTKYGKGIEFFFMLLTLSQKLEELKDWLNTVNRGIQIREEDVKEKKIEDIFKSLIQEMYSPFNKKPRDLLDFEIDEIKESMAATRKNRNSDSDSKEEEASLEDFPANEPNDIRIFGESGPFCIVNLERNILLQGGLDYGLKYYGKLYLFWNNSCKLKFLENPEKYAPYYSPIRCLPPMRIFLMGPIGGGKTIIGKSLSEKFGIHFVDHIKFLNRRLIPHVYPKLSKLKSLDAPLLISNNHDNQAKRAMDEFMSAPFLRRQFWLENPPYYAETWCLEEMIQGYERLQSLSMQSLGDLQLTYETLDPFNENVESIEYADDQGVMFMDRIKENIENYIHGNETLSEYCVRKTLRLLWETEPYSRNGFILKDFPLRMSDTKMLIKNGWIPDMIVEVVLGEDEALERNIEFTMRIWEDKLKQEMVEEQLIEDTVKSIQEMKAMVRRSQLLWEKEHDAKSLDDFSEKYIKRKIDSAEKVIQNSKRKKSALKSGLDFGDANSFSFSRSFTMENRDSELETIIKEEFPPLVFNPIFETYQQGRQRIQEDIRVNYKRDAEEMKNIKDYLRSFNVSWVQITGVDDLQKAVYYLNPFKKRINQRGEFAFPLPSVEMAEQLLTQGFYSLSKFGRLCPVQAYRRKNPIHMFRPLNSRGRIFPIVYRTYVYFVAGEVEKRNFMEDPIKYTFQEPRHPNVPLRLAVIGPPKCGKSLLCKRLGFMFGLKIVTMGGAIRFVLERMSGSVLRKKIDGYLKRGSFLPLSLKVEALTASLNDPDCVTQGFVFDGIPFDAALTQSLAEKKKLPFLILSLVANSEFGRHNRRHLDLAKFRLPYKQRVNLTVKYKEWTETYARFVQWNKATYNNVRELDATRSATEIFYQAYEAIKEPYFDILNYVHVCVSDKPCQLRHLCVSPQEFELRKSPFDHFCPVCWAKKERLVSPVGNKHSGLVQHSHNIYWVCPTHMDSFLNTPKLYLPPNVPKWPDVFPKRLDESEVATAMSTFPVHGFGRCPVTRIDFPSHLEWEGSKDYAVLYMGKVYLCKDEKMEERFVARPWRYASACTVFEENQKVKSNAVEKLGPPVVKSLPPVGFLEQTVSKLIQEALQVLGSTRPVYPNLTPECTACVFIALYLKVHNTQKKATNLEHEYFDFVQYYCRAYRYRVPFSVDRDPTGMQDGLDADDFSDSSESLYSRQTSGGSSVKSNDRNSSMEDSYWPDLDIQADKKIWSAAYQNMELTEMLLTSGDELQEIPDLPKIKVMLRYGTTRGRPLPPISNCLTFIYSVRPPLRLPEPFNVNSMYQPPPPFESPYANTIVCNTGRQFSLKIFSSKSQTLSESKENIFNTRKDERSVDFPLTPNPEHLTEKYLESRFIPKFGLLDVFQPVMPSQPPEVTKDYPMIYEPNRDYTYTMLLAHFFKSSHVLKCYNWMECKQYFEFTRRIDKNLGVCNVRLEYFFQPKITLSQKTARSIESYLQVFDAANTFFFRESMPDRDDSDDDADQASLFNFMELIILEKLEQIFEKISVTDLSYESYETELVFGDSDANLKPKVIIREIFPFPPLIWDIYSRPYYSIRSVPAIFGIPKQESIAHERHISLLDGITEPNERFRFVKYPSWIPDVKGTNMENKRGKSSCLGQKRYEPIYFVYDFFNIDWTAFLPCPFSWEHDLDLRSAFCGNEDY